MFGGIGVGEVVVIVLLLLLLFGAKRIPLIARGIGEGIRNFKTGVRDPDRLDDGEKPRRRDDDEGRG
jgi:sec-independent protein translocase protein TatA